MSSSKQTSEVTLPESITDAANRTLQMSQDVAALPYMPNFGAQVAAYTPAQKAAYAGVQQSANAFGMPYTGTTDAEMGLPTAITNSDGTSGYGTKALYEDAMSKLTPAMRAMLNTFHYDPVTGVNPTSPNLNVTPIPNAPFDANGPVTPVGTTPPPATTPPVNPVAGMDLVSGAKAPDGGPIYRSKNGIYYDSQGKWVRYQPDTTRDNEHGGHHTPHWL